MVLRRFFYVNAIGWWRVHEKWSKQQNVVIPPPPAVHEPIGATDMWYIVTSSLFHGLNSVTRAQAVLPP